MISPRCHKNSFDLPVTMPIELYSPEFYLTCATGGVLSCGLTHLFVTPLDLVKCRLQVNKTRYKGTLNGLSTIAKTEGIAGLYRGGLPTAIGYSLQGACKFGFYEFFKHYYSELVGPENAVQYRTWVYLAGSASAEVIADVALCPLEALKVKTQTNDAFQPGLMRGIRTIMAQDGVSGFFRGLSPLWGRQIPYTMMKFASFEKVVETIYTKLGKSKAEYNKLQQLGVSFVGGYIAGIFCAVVSHPADTLVSKMNNAKKQAGQSGLQLASSIYKDIGFGGLWTGLGTRIFMVGTLTALQCDLY
eukprot:NODE_120_length_17920_cov_0.559782.p4 type:complete len:302 gc:universal NODE_120_length_17920_cov_0.559782:288-1193(+)